MSKEKKVFVISLPMRNWNYYEKEEEIEELAELLVYLWGIETSCLAGWVLGRQGVISLPMRNWNSSLLSLSFFLKYVISLPMRNWNPLKWYPSSFWISVISLPMRNWNIFFIRSRQRTGSRLLVYLWGIETRNRRSCWCRDSVVISLPMRNWNSLRMLLELEWQPQVISLPMRNWNSSILTIRKSWLRVISLPMRNWNLQ